MRLIDADEFLAEASKQLDMQDLYLPVHIKDMVIDTMPTVDAIPVKFIIEYLNKGGKDKISECLKEWEENG